MFSEQTYTERRRTLLSKIGDGIILLCGNSESPANYTNNQYHFRQDSTFLYYCGLSMPDMAAVLDTQSGRTVLFGNDVTMDDIIWMGPQPSVAELARSVGIEHSAPLAELQDTLQKAAAQGRKIHTLPPYRSSTKMQLTALLGRLPEPSAELIRAVVSMRDKKTDEEIEQIEQACETGFLMHTTAMRMCRESVVERDIAGTIEGIALSRGAGVSFASIVSQHGETLHNHCYDGVLQNGRLLLVDAGAEAVSNYCSDFTRTMPVGGRFSTRQKEIYDIVYAANRKAFELSRPGVPYRDVHIASGRVIVEGLKALGLLKGDTDFLVSSGAHSLFMPHGLGHQMGLDVHDMENFGENFVGYDGEITRTTDLSASACRMGRRLQKGMVVTVEPGIYFIPAYIEKWKSEGRLKDCIDYTRLESYYDFGGIRIEDDMLITEQGNRVLGKRHVPETAEEIEAFMAE